MEIVLQHVWGILRESWIMLSAASFYFLAGLLIAGFIHVFLRKETIGKYLGGRSFSSIIYAALVGVPLPLCSCGVLPAAVGLRKDGASKPATLSFLISTPESGIDSIAVTYALIGPFMAFIRPVAAFLTAIAAGTSELFFGNDDEVGLSKECEKCTNKESSASKNNETKFSFIQRLGTGLRYAFVDLLSDITPTFVLGILLGGVIGFYLPTSFVENYLGNGFQSMLIMLFAGIPIYICASASTPIAAALILKGMGPGAALVFLLAGPATNITSLPVIGKTLGWRTVTIYLISIAICALMFGLLTDQLYLQMGWDIANSVGTHHHPVSEPIREGFAGLLLFLMAASLLLGKQRIRSLFSK